MGRDQQPAEAGPATHYELFLGLRDAEVAFLVTGAVALVLHGLPRLTPDIDLAIDPDPGNIARLERRLSTWGYGLSGPPTPGGGGVAVLRFRHAHAALGEIDVVLPAAERFASLCTGAEVVTLVDVGIPLVGAVDLRSLKERSGTAMGHEDAAGLDLLAAIRAGQQGERTDTRREQIRKFACWSVAARLDWLLATLRLARGLSPEARPMTRGLTRRRGWFGR